jgi:FkbM family methyltransferase
MKSKSLNSIKKVIILLGLKRISNYILGSYSKIFQYHVCIRNGIKYSLDLSESIDFATYFGGWEPETIEFIENNVYKDNYVIEVGANVGIQSLHLAQKVGPNGKVFAFEPTEFALSKFIKNCELNPELYSRIRILKYLVTNEQNSTPITTIRSSWQTNQSRRNDELINPNIAISIDKFVVENKIPKLDILKIDVDGYDFKVLQGAKKTILK